MATTFDLLTLWPIFSSISWHTNNLVLKAITSTSHFSSQSTQSATTSLLIHIFVFIYKYKKHWSRIICHGSKQRESKILKRTCSTSLQENENQQIMSLFYLMWVQLRLVCWIIVNCWTLSYTCDDIFTLSAWSYTIG